MTKREKLNPVTTLNFDFTGSCDGDSDHGPRGHGDEPLKQKITLTPWRETSY